jgi:hypothetical protein
MFIATPHDPFEPPDRRWLRAGHLVESGLPPSPCHDDTWVGRAVAYRRALAACRDDEDRLGLAERLPAVAQAHALRLADPPLLRWAVEARILAREGFDVVAKKCAVLPEAVEAYERLFFNVIDKLDASSWVACQVIGPRIHHGLAEEDLDVLWKFFGYAYGPVVLDALIHGTLGLPRPATAREAAEVLARDADALWTRKKSLATHLLPVTPETAAQVLQLAAQLGAIGRTGANSRDGAWGLVGAELDRLLGVAVVDAAPARPTRPAGGREERVAVDPPGAVTAPVIALPPPAGLPGGMATPALPAPGGRDVA